MRRKKTVTLLDLAESLQLTVHTVSKALRGLPGMSEETRLAVIRKARELGYRTKDQERSMAIERIPFHIAKGRRFHFIISAGSDFNMLIRQGLEQRLKEFGHSLESVILPDGIKAGGNLASWVEQEDLAYSDGLFLSPALPEDAESGLLALRLPTVLLNFPPHTVQVDSVVWDVVHAIHQSVRHLAACGHQKVLYLGDIRQHRGFRLRWQAFQEAMADEGIRVVPEEHLTELPGNKEEWLDRLVVMLQRHRPTAILCALQNDLHLFHEACRRCGCSIPGDISLISLEHARSPEFPTLTRPILLVRETGERAAERMLWRIGNPGVPYEHIRLQGDFYVGDTVRKL